MQTRIKLLLHSSQQIFYNSPLTPKILLNILRLNG